MSISRNNFLNISASLANEIANHYGTPVFIMDEKGLISRFAEFQQAVSSRYSQSIVAISYKTNFIKGLLTLLHRQGAHAEVVSGIEYAVAKELRLPQQYIVFNGPMKTDVEIVEAIKDEAMINCDHMDEIIRIENIAQTLNKQVKIGIRIYFIEESKFWNRFGFGVSKNLSDELTINLIKRIIISPYLKLAGLHGHIGTNIRELKQFSLLSEYLCEFATELKKQFNIELLWIDVGGGLAGISPYKNTPVEAHPLPDVEDYANAVINPLLPYLQSLSHAPLLIFEPGRTIFEAAGALLTKIVGHRSSNETELNTYICDAGMNALSTCHTYDFPIHTFIPGPYQKTQLLGPTCNQQDQLHSPLNLPNLTLGDLILFYGVGSYCMAFSYSFIRYKPGVILWRGDHTQWLRKPETLEHLAKLDCIPA